MNVIRHDYIIGQVIVFTIEMAEGLFDNPGYFRTTQKAFAMSGIKILFLIFTKALMKFILFIR
jgi:hypothetical protein